MEEYNDDVNEKNLSWNYMWHFCDKDYSNDSYNNIVDYYLYSPTVNKWTALG